MENNLNKKIDFDAIKKLKFDERGLIPAIAQDVNTKEVLMLAYMNEESIRKTLEEKRLATLAEVDKNYGLKD